MRWFLFMTLVLVVCNVAAADTYVVVQNVTSAQQDAERMARTGGPLRHCGTAGGRREGIGYSSVSADAAVRSCCYYADAMRGRYRIVERGVARGPRGWYAVIRYE